ncbi:MAG: ATP-dependent protease subunit HslV [Clostridiales bacterium]|nr:ATP-dependent protease subunit HslV [Candidatus Apopatousia equi]
MDDFKGTTICAVRKDGKTCICGDGQVTMGQSVIAKGNAVKVRRIYNDKVVVGFAGTVSDAFALSSRLEEMLNKFSGNLMRSAVELALQFRNDEVVRKLEALMIVADKDNLLMISGTGEVLEAENDIIAIGSGGNYALAAARALKDNTDLSARDIAKKALEIAGGICVFTNGHLTLEEV